MQKILTPFSITWKLNPMPMRLFGCFLLFFSPVVGFASETMFEGYYRIDHETKPIGYFIQRYAFDSKTNTFEAQSFLRAKFGDKMVQESLKAKCTDKFHPISYQYTSQVGETINMIDATFKGEIMKLTRNDGKVQKNETYKIPKGTFLSTFLTYLMMQQKMKLNDAFKYSAVAEEDGNSYWGKAWLQGKESSPGYEVFTVMNKFKNEEFVSKLAVVRDPKSGKTVKGEVLSTNSPAKNVSTKLMPSPAAATEGQMVPNKTLLTVFGNVPSGKLNLVAAPPDVDGPAGPGGTIASPVPPDQSTKKITEKQKPAEK